MCFRKNLLKLIIYLDGQENGEGNDNNGNVSNGHDGDCDYEQVGHEDVAENLGIKLMMMLATKICAPVVS